MTESGFTGSKDVLIPEYMTTSLEDDKSKSNITPTDGMIFKVYEDENGNPVEEPYAWYSEDAKRFIRIKKGEENDR